MQCPVEQGQTGVGAVLGIVGGVQVLVKAGVVRSRQHAAVLHIQHHRSAGGSFHIAGVVHPVDHVDIVGKCLVHRPLKVAVDGQLHGMPRLRYGGNLGVHDHAVRIAGDGLHAVLAAQFVLVHGLKAGDADHIVHVIAFFLERIGHLTVFVGHLPLFGGDLTHTPQHSGQDIALLVAAGAGLHDLHARQREGMLLDGSHRHLTDVFRHNKVVHVGKGLPVHLVMDACQHTLPRQGEAFQMVFLHQHLHHIVGGGVLLQAQRLLHVCQRFLVAGAVGAVRKGIVPGGIRLADEQGVQPFFIVLAQKLHDLLQHGVQILISHLQLVQHHIIAGAGGSDALAGAVHDIAARGGDRELIIRGVGGFCLEAVPVDQLQKDQPEGVQPHDDAGHCDEQQHPPHHDLAFIFVHLVLLLRVRPHRCRS